MSFQRLSESNLGFWLYVYENKVVNLWITQRGFVETCHTLLSPDVPCFCFNCRLGFYYYYLKACH